MARFDDAIDMQALIRRLAEQVVNAAMDAEADRPCNGGAKSRNGYRESGIAAFVRTLTQLFTKLRSNSFFPQDVIERYQSVDRAPCPPWPRSTPPTPALARYRGQPREMGVT